MDQVLKVESRPTGKKSAKSLRREGKVPGIFYLHGEESVPIAVDAKALRTVSLSDASIVDLEYSDGRKTKCVIREIQRDPVRGEFLHVDLMGIRLTEMVAVEVPVHLTGVAVGVKEKGGVLQQSLRYLEIECLPLDIPEHVELDVSALDVNESLHVADIVLDRVKILTEPEQTVVSIRPPSVQVEAVEEVEVEGEEGVPEGAPGAPEAEEPAAGEES